MSENELYESIQNAAYDLTEKIKTYSNMVDLRRKDFAELTLMLLEYWSLDNDLSAVTASTELSYNIEDKVIDLAKKYNT